MRTAQKYRIYAEWIGEGDATRSQAAEHFGVAKSTATYHLERAVAEGMLERFYSWTDEYQTGWAYRKPGAQPTISFEGEVEEDHDLLDKVFENGSSALDLDTWTEYPPDGEVNHIMAQDEYYADRVWDEYNAAHPVNE
jgi:DNA-binding transcriptional ArsR family regulator